MGGNIVVQREQQYISRMSGEVGVGEVRVAALTATGPCCTGNSRAFAGVKACVSRRLWLVAGWGDVHV